MEVCRFIDIYIFFFFFLYFFLNLFFFILKFCPLSSTDLVSVTGAWSLVWGLMAGLWGFASHEGGNLSGGWLWKWKPPDDPGTHPP